MTKDQWIPILIGLLGGGAAGAIINTLVSSYRNKIQKIGKKVDIIPIFKNSNFSSKFQAKLNVFDGVMEYKYDNMYIAQIVIVNKGNKDYKEFVFGLSLNNNEKAIFAEFESSDRHHLISELSPIEPGNSKSDIDLQLAPFNRKDTYFIKLYIVQSETQSRRGDIRFSSPEPITFIDVPTFSEKLLYKIIKEVLEDMIPIMIGYR